MLCTTLGTIHGTMHGTIHGMVYGMVQSIWYMVSEGVCYDRDGGHNLANMGSAPTGLPTSRTVHSICRHSGLVRLLLVLFAMIVFVV